MNEKLQKVLARIGLGSRRELEQWISEGRVSVNGKLATLGDRVGASDVVRVDGRVIGQAAMQGPERRVLVYHKPLGEVCTRIDPEKRPTIFEKMPPLRNGRWVAVGRLDVNTTGVILLTTDGELANRLMHPSSTVEREYAVRVFGEVSPEVLQRLREGVMLDDGPARFDSIYDAGGDGANHWYHVTLHEGRNREVRRLWELQGVTVSRLIRVRYGPVQLGRRLRPGRYEELEGETLQALLQLVGLARPGKAVRGREGVAKQTAAGTAGRNAPRKGRAGAEEPLAAARARPSARKPRAEIDEWSTSPHPPAASRKGQAAAGARPGASRARPAPRKDRAAAEARPTSPRSRPAARKPSTESEGQPAPTGRGDTEPAKAPRRSPGKPAGSRPNRRR